MKIYPLESYVTHVSHRNLQGAPTESNENSSNGRIPLRIQKDSENKEINSFNINLQLFGIFCFKIDKN